MAEDREILREVWEGRIPVCISLASEDCNTLSAPDPHYLLVPRISYFPLVLEKVRKNFLRSVNVEHQNAEMWLEFEGTPLKWHYPIGVLYDLLMEDASLPWNLIAHFSNFPEDELIRCSTNIMGGPLRDAIESHFLSVVKEADGLKHRGQIVTNMQSKDHKQLWMGLCNDKFDQFWAINRKLMDSGQDNFKYIPFRIHRAHGPPVQRLVKPYTDDGRRMDLLDLLQETNFHASCHNLKILIQGLVIPPDTPLQWLSEHLSHPDNFLHITVIKAR